MLVDSIARTGISDSDGYTINPDVRRRFRQVLDLTGSPQVLLYSERKARNRRRDGDGLGLSLVRDEGFRRKE
jgi:hypothetical protein